MAEVNLDDGSHFLSTDHLARKKRFDLSPGRIAIHGIFFDHGVRW
jgi:hypothetical protein